MQFHIDIPRLFMLPTTEKLNKYHDKKRTLDFYKIANVVDLEN